MTVAGDSRPEGPKGARDGTSGGGAEGASRASAENGTDDRAGDALDDTASQSAEDPAPHLPRAPFLSRLNVADLFRIGMFATLLIAIIVLRKPCADSVGRFIGTFEDSDAGAAEMSGTDAGPRGERLEGYQLIPADEVLDVLSDGGTLEDLE